MSTAVADTTASTETSTFGTNVGDILASSFRPAEAPAQAPAPTESKPADTAEKAPESIADIKRNIRKIAREAALNQYAPESKQPTPAQETQTAPVAADPEQTAQQPKQSDKDINFANLRKAKEDLERKYQEIEKQYKELQTKAQAPQVPPDYEQIKKERDEFSKVVEQIKIENHPVFHQQVTGPLNQKAQELVSILTALGAEEADVRRALKAPDVRARKESLKEYLQAADSFDQAEIASLLRQHDDLDKQYRSALNQPEVVKKNLETYQQQEQQRHRQQSEQLFEVLNKELRGRVPLFAERNGDEEWNKNVVHQATERAKKLWLGQSTDQEIITAFHESAMVPTYAKMLRNAGERIQSLESQLKSYQAQKPTVNATTSEAEVVQAPSSYEEARKSFSSTIHRARAGMAD